MRCFLLTANLFRLLLVLALASAEVALLAVVADGQSTAPPKPATMQVFVRNTRQRPLAGATVHLHIQGETQSLAAQTDGQGQCRFTGVRPGAYTLRAELPGYGNASFGPFIVQPGSPKTVNLTLPSSGSSQNSSGSLQFFDEPQFTIAGVTDPTALGGHGSNATAPARDDLAREVVSLGGPSSGSSSAKPADDEQALRQAAERQPADFIANHRLGKLLLDRGQAREALPYLQRASRLHPADYQSSYDLALAYSEAGEYDQARANLQSLLPTYERPELHHLLGDVEEKQGHSLEAAREYERAAQLDPSEPNFFDWGAELLVHRAAEPAAQVFGQGARRFPGSVRLLLGLGVAWFAQGSYDQAARYLCQASDLDPADPHPYLFLGKIQEVEASSSEQTAERLARFARLRPDDPQANYYYALTLWKQSKSAADSGNLSQVASLLQKAVQLDSGFALAHLQLAIFYAEQKRYPEAISSYQKAIAADPRLPDAHYRLAQAYNRTGETAKARAELQLYGKLAKEKAQQSERERSHMQQFVYTLRNQNSPSQPR